MTKVMTVSQARTNIYKIMDETAQTHQPDMLTSIKEAMDSPNSEDIEG